MAGLGGGGRVAGLAWTAQPAGPAGGNGGRSQLSEDLENLPCGKGEPLISVQQKGTHG